jgi:hypothetical protein
MTFPKSVSIGGMQFSISIEDGMTDHGQFCFDDRKITLRLSDDNTMIETLRHEMMHAAFAVAGISYSKLFDEEIITRCMDNVFFPAWCKIATKLKRKS